MNDVEALVNREFDGAVRFVLFWCGFAVLAAAWMGTRFGMSWTESEDRRKNRRVVAVLLFVVQVLVIMGLIAMVPTAYFELGVMCAIPTTLAILGLATIAVVKSAD
jgi:hypothetical protein